MATKVSNSKIQELSHLFKSTKQLKHEIESATTIEGVNKIIYKHVFVQNIYGLIEQYYIIQVVLGSVKPEWVEQIKQETAVSNILGRITIVEPGKESI